MGVRDGIHQIEMKMGLDLTTVLSLKTLNTELPEGSSSPAALCPAADGLRVRAVCVCVCVCM